MAGNSEIRIHPCEPISDGKLCLFEIRERFELKSVERKVYYDKHDGLYITYKGKRYFEYEFVY